MDFIANTDTQNEEMLKAIGIQTIDPLFHAIPQEIRLLKPTFDDGISEFEGLRHMEDLAKSNTFSGRDNYLGAGAYEHHIPAVVRAICSKSEFLTSYTPYQAEASQGMLQAIFEFQSSICFLTGLDTANASLYDGASATAEASLMALRIQEGRHKILIGQSIHPHYLQATKLYLQGHGVELVEIPFTQAGTLDLEWIKREMNHQTAAVILQSPNFFGILESVSPISQLAKSCGALTVLVANPLSYGICKSAGEQDVDIAVGDCQPFGIPLQFGGPYVGYMACKQQWMRQLPGRIVGTTHDNFGKEGFILTLQAREQHIRREKATSNICTNQSLCSLASLVSLSWYGKEGLPKLALTNYQRAAYLKAGLEDILGKHPFAASPHFNEFVVQFQRPIEKVIDHFRQHQIEAGIPLKHFFPQYGDALLIAVTETKNQQQLDHYLEVARHANHI